MSAVTHATVAAEDDGIRLDRWFKRHRPDIPFGILVKLLRTGQVRLDGKRIEAGERIAAGQEIRIPPVELSDTPPPKPGPKPVSEKDAKDLLARVLFKDAHVLVLDKPPGLAVQGGSGTTRHLDGMLDALRFDADERPRLVHRLDRDTSGVLVLGRSAAAAAALTRAFQGRDIEKYYWAVVVGVPSPREGKIDVPLSKEADASGYETMQRGAPGGQKAISLFRTVTHAWPKAAWLELQPVTGRTHQLRVHCAHIGTPIVGDRKYGGAGAVIDGAEIPDALHLHARTLILPLPGGGRKAFEAPLPRHMRETFDYFGFDLGEGKRG